VTGTVTVSDRDTGYLCLVDIETAVPFRFGGGTAEGGAVNWYLADPTALESYWDGGDGAVYASFSDWTAFDFGPYTAGAAPTALLVEPVDGTVTLSYSLTLG